HPGRLPLPRPFHGDSPPGAVLLRHGEARRGGQHLPVFPFGDGPRAAAHGPAGAGRLPRGADRLAGRSPPLRARGRVIGQFTVTGTAKGPKSLSPPLVWKRLTFRLVEPAATPVSVPANAEVRVNVRVDVSAEVALSWKLPPCATGSWAPA